MIHLIYFYLLINAFITGLYIAKAFPEPIGKELITAFFLSLLGILFALPITLFAAIYSYLTEHYTIKKS